MSNKAVNVGLVYVFPIKLRDFATRRNAKGVNIILYQFFKVNFDDSF